MKNMQPFKALILALIILIPTKSFSQDLPLSLDDLIPGGKSFAKRHQYRSTQPRQLRWFGDRLTYVKGDSILVVSTNKSKKDEVLLSLQDINRMGLDDVKSINAIGSMHGDANSVYIYASDKAYLLNIVEGAVSGHHSIDASMKNLNYSIASKTMAYTRDNNLYIQTSEGEEVAITNESDKDIVNGQSVHQNEFGINKGIFWSPRGTAIAFYRMDESMVTDYPLVDASARIAKSIAKKYPMAGMKSHHVTIGIYDVESDKTIFLDTGAPQEKYLTNIAWSPDEKYIYLAELNRGQDVCIVKSYDAVTGKLHATLFTEEHAKYVEPQNPALFTKNDSDKFIWQSYRDGYNHAYLYSTSGELLKQITSGNWDIASILGFDEKGEHLVYLSNENSPIEKHIYKVNLKTGKRTQLSKEEGVHSASLSQSGKYLYDTYTAQSNPGKVAFTDVKTNKTNIFHEGKNPYHDVTLPEITLGSIKSNDGTTDLYYRLIKPLNFDANKKYPVVVYVYGGPHSQMVNNSWLAAGGGWHIYMAQKGYVVFTLDNRGTKHRGIDFENITHRQLGVIETQDQMSGIEFLKSQSYVDANRIGVHGWSYGGFMTLNMMLRHPETFKVGVAGGPVTDWQYYEIMYGERYMDSPQENADGYKATSMVDRAGDLQGRLLLIHGDEDPVVVLQHSLQYLKSSVKHGAHPDLFIYTGHGHNMGGSDRVHLHEHITRYFDDFLK